MPSNILFKSLRRQGKSSVPLESHREWWRPSITLWLERFHLTVLQVLFVTTPSKLLRIEYKNYTTLFLKVTLEDHSSPALANYSTLLRQLTPGLTFYLRVHSWFWHSCLLTEESTFDSQVLVPLLVLIHPGYLQNLIVFPFRFSE